MTAGTQTTSLNRKATIAATIGAIAVFLLVGDRLVGPGAEQTLTAVPTQDAAGIQEVVDTLFGRYGVDRTAVKTWRVTMPDKTPLRMEQRIPVPSNFPSLVFNHDLNRRLAPFGAHVIATERTKENTITMHIVTSGTTIRSMAFVLQSDH